MITLIPRGIVRCCAGLAFALFFGLGSIGRAEIPSLIQRQPDSILQAWIEIDTIVAENEKLTPPLPEPYVARGDLWSRVGSHEDAMSDYLKATDLFFRGSPTPSEQARYLSQLRRALDAVVKQPKPNYPYEAASEYSLGLLAIRNLDYTAAASHFTESSRLMPEVALYRAYRALALHELGRNEEAQRQAAVALSLIRATGSDASGVMQALHRSLEHVQGPTRSWLSRELELTSKPPATKRDAVH